MGFNCLSAELYKTTSITPLIPMVLYGSRAVGNDRESLTSAIALVLTQSCAKKLNQRDHVIRVPRLGGLTVHQFIFIG